MAAAIYQITKMSFIISTRVTGKSRSLKLMTPPSRVKERTLTEAFNKKT